MPMMASFSASGLGAEAADVYCGAGAGLAGLAGDGLRSCLLGAEADAAVFGVAWADACLPVPPEPPPVFASTNSVFQSRRGVWPEAGSITPRSGEPTTSRPTKNHERVKGAKRRAGTGRSGLHTGLHGIAPMIFSLSDECPARRRRGAPRACPPVSYATGRRMTYRTSPNAGPLQLTARPPQPAANRAGSFGRET